MGRKGILATLNSGQSGTGKIISDGTNVAQISASNVGTTSASNFGLIAGGTTRVNLRKDGSSNYHVNVALPGAAPSSDSFISASNVAIYLNEAGNTLTFRVKYSDGTTVKSGTVALT